MMWLKLSETGSNTLCTGDCYLRFFYKNNNYNVKYNLNEHRTIPDHFKNQVPYRIAKLYTSSFNRNSLYWIPA